MKIIVLGAGGNLGIRLVRQGLDFGYQVTAFVRDEERFRTRWNASFPVGLKVVEGDIHDESVLAKAVTGHSALINAAGNVHDGENFEALFRTVITIGAERLSEPKRMWLLGGAAALDIPHTRRQSVGLPGVPAVYQRHVNNWHALRASNADWSLMCPGPMVAAPEGPPKLVEISTDVLPYPLGPWTRVAPPFALALSLKNHMPRMIVPYDEVARVILSNLAPDGPMTRRRVGVALRAGDSGSKEGWTPGQRAGTE